MRTSVTTDSLVRDRIICGIQDRKLQENILRTYLEDVKLDKVIKLCRVASEARAQSDMLNESTGVNRVSCMSISSENQNTVHRAERTSVKRGNHTSAKTYKCTKYCDTNHLAGECPAFHHIIGVKSVSEPVIMNHVVGERRKASA